MIHLPNASLVDPDGDGYSAILSSAAAVINAPTLDLSGKTVLRFRLYANLLSNSTNVRLQPNGADTGVHVTLRYGRRTPGGGTISNLIANVAYCQAAGSTTTGATRMYSKGEIDLETFEIYTLGSGYGDNAGTREHCAFDESIGSWDGATLTSLRFLFNLNVDAGSWLKIWLE